MRRATVVGGGLSGLAAAWHLAEAGFAVQVCEAADRPGGLIQTVATPLGPVETAANAFVWNDEVAAWFARLGLTPAFARKASRRRYIFRDGRPRRWPLSAAESAGFCARLLREGVLRRWGARDDESVAAWGARVVGPAGVRWLLAPALQGIYAAPPDRLSARAVFGGRTRGPRVMAAPSGGMGTFIAALCDRLRDRGVPISLDTRVDRLPAGDVVLMATAAPEAGRLLAGPAPQAGAAIARVAMAGLVTATAFFEPQAGDLRGFGVLFPAGNGVTALGVLMNTEIFEGRGPARSETWIYAAESAPVDDGAVAAQVTRDRGRLTGRDAPPLHVHTTHWLHAIPVYGDPVARLNGIAGTLPPGLAIAGNYLGRLGVTALLATARDAAERVR